MNVAEDIFDPRRNVGGSASFIGIIVTTFIAWII